VNRPVGGGEHARDRGPIVEVDDDRGGAACGDPIRLGVVADQRGHLVAVLDLFGEDV
jgi:hypothetical protein